MIGLLRIDRGQLAPWRALRAGLVVGVLTAGGWLLGGASAAIGMGIASLVAGFITVTSVSPPFGVMAAASLAMTISTFVGALAVGNTIALVILFFAWGCVAGLLTLLGPAGTSIGINSIVGLVAFGHIPAGFRGATEAAGWVLVGGLVQAVATWSTNYIAQENDLHHSHLRRPRGATAAQVLAVLDALWATVAEGAKPLRHGIRLGVTLAAGLGIAQAIGLAHGYWAPLSAALTLRPSLSTTWVGGLRRAVGTCVGAGLAGIIATELHVGFAGIAILVGLLSFGGLMFLPSNAAIGIALYSAAIVLLIGIPSHDTGAAALQRSQAALIGGALAVLVLLVWRERRPPDLSSAIRQSIQTERTLVAALYSLAGRRESIPSVNKATNPGWLALFASNGAVTRSKDETPERSAQPWLAVIAGLRHIHLVSSASFVTISKHPSRLDGTDEEWVAVAASALDHRLANLEQMAANGASPSRSPLGVPEPADATFGWHAKEVSRTLTSLEHTLEQQALAH